jgi:putative spermidine/putrescine transport system permease protein
MSPNTIQIKTPEIKTPETKTPEIKALQARSFQTARRFRWRMGVLPLAAFYAVFFVAPQIFFMGVSFFTSTGPGQYDAALTVTNYTSLFSDSFIYRAIVNTLQLSTCTAFCSVLIGFSLAFAIAHNRRVGRYLFMLVIATMFSSAVALALGWQALLSSNGGVNGALMAIGLLQSPLPLSSNMTSILIGMVHGAIPVSVLGLLPACEALSMAQVEAARGLGASSLRVFHQVILPQTSRALLSVFLIVFAVTTSAFTTPALLGGGRVALLPLAIREQLLVVFNYPKAAAISVILIVATIIVVLLVRQITTNRQYANA